MATHWLPPPLPIATTLAHYRREQFVGDLVAGLVVAIMLVPQSMAYAMLAGLPPQVGLYASVVPLCLYSLFGSSPSLAVGPVAMVSLLVITGVGQLATPGSPAFIQLCLTLAMLAGLLQIAMAAFRLGFLVNFISHPVLVGFTSAAAITIGVSQVQHLCGISVERGDDPVELIANTLSQISQSNMTTLAIGTASCLLLWCFRYHVSSRLVELGINGNTATTIGKVGPLVVVVCGSLTVFGGGFSESESVAIVGEIPSGFPGLTSPSLHLDSLGSLLPLALTIALVGYMESISVAKSLASRKREKIDANRELFALGMADLGAAFTGGYPITGGFSRSLVNDAAGARTPLSSMLTALFVLISVMFLTPLFYYIPKAVLAAIIIVAVVPLVDFRTPIKLWRYSRADAVALLVTFIAVLIVGIESGILAGVAVTVMTLMWKMSRPHIAEVGRVKNTEHFRNILRHDVELTKGVLAFRIDESLNFANSPFLESYVTEQVADRSDIKSVVLIASGVNDIDATGLEVLETIHRELKSVGIGFYLSDVKGPVTDRFQLAGYDRSFLDKHIFLSADQAVASLASS